MLQQFAENVAMFRRYSKLLVKTRFQYKLDAFLLSFAVFCREAVGIIVVYLTLRKFDAINGWRMPEMLFLFSLIFLTYSLLVLFFTGIRDFDSLIHSGSFDRYLLRPQGLLFQVIASKADYFASIGHGSLGVILFLTTAQKVGIVWNLPNIVYYCFSIIGGVMIQAAIFMLFSCFSFWTVKTGNLRGFFFFNARKFAGYPLSIFPGFIQTLLIYIMPFAFVNYFPAQYLLRKPDMAMYWDGCLYLTLPIGVILFGLAYLFWQFGLKHYSSTGN
ncbi:MAG TPA: ABC-2 family transporter protein [Bacillota bacterium]|nr:ABC-2 family transporter protein [Bacillota bacterium]